MQDTVIKCTGNSRAIRMPPNTLTIYPTWEAFVAGASSQFGAPVDILGPDPAGCDVIGTALNKENLLTDETAALFGFGTDATPDQVLAKIQPSVEAVKKLGSCEFYTTSYTGTGTTGNYSNGAWTSYAVTLNFPHKPVVVFVVEDAWATPIVNGQTSFYTRGINGGRYGNAVWSGKTLRFATIYSGYPELAFNYQGVKYSVLALLDMKN